MEGMFKSENGAMIAGVCSGLASYFKTDTTLVRIAFVIFTFFGGAGIIIYLLLVIIMPEEKEHEKKETLSEEIGRHLTRSHNHSHAIFGFFIIILGVIFLIDNFFPGFELGKLWPLLLIAVGGLIMFKRHST